MRLDGSHQNIPTWDYTVNGSCPISGSQHEQRSAGHPVTVGILQEKYRIHVFWRRRDYIES